MEPAIILIIVSLIFALFKRDWFLFYTSKRYNSRGLKYLKNCEYEKAKVAFKKAYRLETESDKRRVIFLRHISLAYQRLGEIESGYYYLLESLKYCEPNSYDFYVNKGNAVWLNGKITRAIAYLDKAIIIDPNGLKANNLLGVIYSDKCGKQRKDLEKGLLYNRKAHEILDNNITKSNLAMAYLDMGDLGNSESLFEEIIASSPNNLHSSYCLARIYYFRGKWELSRQLFAHILNRDKSYAMGIEDILIDLKLNV